MERLTRTKKYADLRNNMSQNKEESLYTEELNNYEDKLSKLESFFQSNGLENKDDFFSFFDEEKNEEKEEAKPLENSAEPLIQKIQSAINQEETIKPEIKEEPEEKTSYSLLDRINEAVNNPEPEQPVEETKDVIEETKQEENDPLVEALDLLTRDFDTFIDNNKEENAAVIEEPVTEEAPIEEVPVEVIEEQPQEEVLTETIEETAQEVNEVVEQPQEPVQEETITETEAVEEPVQEINEVVEPVLRDKEELTEETLLEQPVQEELSLEDELNRISIEETAIEEIKEPSQEEMVEETPVETIEEQPQEEAIEETLTEVVEQPQEEVIQEPVQEEQIVETEVIEEPIQEVNEVVETTSDVEEPVQEEMVETLQEQQEPVQETEEIVEEPAQEVNEVVEENKISIPAEESFPEINSIDVEKEHEEKSYVDEILDDVKAYNKENNNKDVAELSNNIIDEVRHPDGIMAKTTTEFEDDEEYSQTISLEIEKVLNEMKIENNVSVDPIAVMGDVPNTDELEKTAEIAFNDAEVKALENVEEQEDEKPVVSIKNLSEIENENSTDSTISFPVEPEEEQDSEEVVVEDGAGKALNVILGILIFVLIAVLGVIVYYILLMKGII